MLINELTDLQAYHERRCQQEMRWLLGYCSEQAANAHRQLLDFHRMMLLDLIHSD
ncbi:hypothetical protein [Sphingomonas mollis]|uniref:Uncharacterized protein n=1 Tax=Sphingomonas mollis TaxID=2795726 RepID=A0ABS0XTY1_9SPHN|nr:hypothetical protein [Sphingomonas sp. BT553]MBJ6123482.1 hypothetical protein [Sphingomonas sp. BT553]